MSLQKQKNLGLMNEKNIHQVSICTLKKIFISAIHPSVQSTSNEELFTKPKLIQTHNPKSIIDFAIGYPEEEGFRSETDYFPTHVLSNLYEYIDDSNHITEELKKCRAITEYIQASFFSYGINYGYQRKFSFLRNIKLESHRQAYIKDHGLPFVRALIKQVYQKYYGFGSEYDQNNFMISIDGTSHPSKYTNFSDKFRADFLHTVAAYTLMSIQGIYDKITDYDMYNCFMNTPVYFDHYLNVNLSGAALSLSAFHHKLLGLTRSDKTETYYNEGTLPRVTYVSFTGIYSEIDIDVLTTFSQNIQIILLYDENTGGPDMYSNTSGTFPEFDSRHEKWSFRAISDRILLLPVRRFESQQVLGPAEIYEIFRSIISPAIQNFKPEHIVFNHSFIFNGENNRLFHLDKYYLGKIVRDLVCLSDARLTIFPFKIPVKATDDILTTFIQLEHEFKEKFKNKTPSKEDLANHKFIIERTYYLYKNYGVEYNRKYFRDCFFICMETMAQMRKYKSKHFIFREDRVTHPYLGSLIKAWSNHYSTHSYYHFLFSKSSDLLSSQSIKNFKDQIIFSNEFFKKVRLADSDRSLKEASLPVESQAELRTFIPENVPDPSKSLQAISQITSLDQQNKSTMASDYASKLLAQGNLDPSVQSSQQSSSQSPHVIDVSKQSKGEIPSKNSEQSSFIVSNDASSRPPTGLQPTSQSPHAIDVSKLSKGEVPSKQSGQPSSQAIEEASSRPSISLQPKSYHLQIQQSRSSKISANAAILDQGPEPSKIEFKTSLNNLKSSITTRYDLFIQDLEDSILIFNSKKLMPVELRLDDLVAFIHKETIRQSQPASKIQSIKLSKDSKHLVDYKDGKIFLINAVTEKSDSLEKVSHYQFDFEQKEEGVIKLINWRSLPQFRIIKRKSNQTEDDRILVTNQTLCYFKKCLFSVYGIVDSGEFGEILYIDTSENNSNWTQFKIKHGKKTAFLRYNVTVCPFESKTAQYLMVCGGEILPTHLPNEQHFDMYNFVEVYRFSGLGSRNMTDAELFTLDKNKLVGTSHLPYIPYMNSYAYEQDKKVYIIGGYGTERSIYDWTVHLFELNVDSKPEDWEIIDVKVLLNTLVDPANEIDPEKKSFRKPHNIDDLISVADKNRNFIQIDNHVHFIYKNSGRIYHSTYTKDTDIKTRVYQSTLNALTNQKFITKFEPPKPSSTTSHRNNIPGSLSQSIFKLYNKTNVPKENLEENQMIKKLDFNRKSLQIKMEVINESIAQPSIDIKKSASQISQLPQDSKNLLSKSAASTAASTNSYKQTLSSKNSTTMASYCLNTFNASLYGGTKTASLPSPSPSKINSTLQAFSKSNLLEKHIKDAKANTQSPLSYNLFVNYIHDPLTNEYTSFENLLKFLKPKNNEEPIEYNEDLSTADTLNQEFTQKKRLIEKKDTDDSSHKFIKLVGTQTSSDVIYFFNKQVSALIAAYPDKGKTIICRFQVAVYGKKINIDFKSGSTPSLFNSALICYIDSTFEDSYPEVYKQFHHQILYADCQKELISIEKTEQFEYESIFHATLTLKPLITVTMQKDIRSRTLLLNKKYIFMLGGEVVINNFKVQTKKYSSKILRISYKSNPIEFKDLDMDLEEPGTEIALVRKEDSFIAVRKDNPTYLQKFDTDGLLMGYYKVDDVLRMRIAREKGFEDRKIDVAYWKSDSSILLDYVLPQEWQRENTRQNVYAFNNENKFDKVEFGEKFLYGIEEFPYAHDFTSSEHFYALRGAKLMKTNLNSELSKPTNSNNYA